MGRNARALIRACSGRPDLNDLEPAYKELLKKHARHHHFDGVDCFMMPSVHCVYRSTAVIKPEHARDLEVLAQIDKTFRRYQLKPRLEMFLPRSESKKWRRLEAGPVNHLPGYRLNCYEILGANWSEYHSSARPVLRRLEYMNPIARWSSDQAPHIFARNFLSETYLAFDSSPLTMEKSEVESLLTGLDDGSIHLRVITGRNSLEPLAGALMVAMGEAFELAWLWTRKEIRQMGLARYLLEQMMRDEEIIQQGYCWLISKTAISSKLYSSMGFSALGWFVTGNRC